MNKDLILQHHGLCFATLVASAMIAGCSGETDSPAIDAAIPVDAGVDAGADAGSDAGSPDADAGDFDFGQRDADVDGGADTDSGSIDLGAIVPLFDENTPLQPALFEDTPAALISRFADRGRDRHARESQFQAYEHYLPLYWEYRTAQIEIIDSIAKGGTSIVFNITTEWKIQAPQAELRFFYRGLSTVAEYHDNRVMTRIDDLHYTHEVSFNVPQGRALRVGDKMEFELSQFLDAPPRGRTNYYGTTYLYVVGQGIVPWIGDGPNRDSNPIDVAAQLGGQTTIHASESNEPEFAFSQMATNIAIQNGQPFVLGRRAAHTDFDTGAHDESAENPVWSQQATKAGPLYINASCNGCHERNGRARPPALGQPLSQHVVKVGDASGAGHLDFGSVLQPVGGEPQVRLQEWVAAPEGLRRPVYEFDAPAPEFYSPRISPQLVGLGLLEAIPESAIEALADPDDTNTDGISGRARRVVDAESGATRLGRFGYKASQPTLRQQTASALRTDMGVMTSVFTSPDCGSAQTNCGASGQELDDQILDDLTLYVALLGMRPQRHADSPEVVQGRTEFRNAGCESCHVAEFVTSAFAPLAELREQTIAPFTDLLLHDMGPGLADNLPEADAAGAEWRTAPLWGIGLTAGVSGGQSYLHDGRARTLTEAILWHGGEAQSAKDNFVALNATQKMQLLQFLQSL